MPSYQECLNTFAAEIAAQHLSTYLVVVLGGLIVLTGLYLLITKRINSVASIIVLLIGLAASAFAATGYIPSLAGKLSDPEFANTIVVKTIKQGCREQASFEAAIDLPSQKKASVVPQNEQTEALVDAVREDSLVWVYYDPSRKADFIKLRDKLEAAGVTINGGADDFAQVKRKQNSGTTRIIFDEDTAKPLALAISNSAKEIEIASSPVVEGPYNIKKGPVQVQLW